MIEYMADTFYSVLNELLPMIRDVIGAAFFLAFFTYPIIIFVSFSRYVKKCKKINKGEPDESN